ncbi:unnamed protein product [Blepharisma stoltei]|uniref:EF-hand domain-containing protein n=1 Tax=Blepharisma stoltei TaxID=1481888 RepID=A0AAU9J1V4_9CILI|nr:unnamed protein product [Blepharisma stoltei]
MKAVDPSIRHVIDKFKRKGFNHLTLEEIAITQTSPNFPEEFKTATGEDWHNFQEKADERLRRAKFNIKWLTRQNDNMFSPLFAATLRGDLKKLDEFLKISDLNACKDAVDETKKSCLHLASREGHFDIVKSLVAKGWSIDARDKLLSTPLHLACTNGHANIIAFLLSKGADIHARDSLGRTALLFAACSTNSQAITVLLNKDTRALDGKDYTGRSALHYAIFNPHPKQVEIIRKLLESGIPVDIPDSDNKTPLHHACEAGKPRSIRILLKWGANIESKDSMMKSPVDLAANQNIKQLVLLYGNEPEPIQNLSHDQKLTEDKLPSIKKTKPDKPIFEPPSVQSSENREKLIAFLKKIQEAGINTNQHALKPQIYSSAWLNSVQSAGALHREFAKLTPSEAVLQVFNVLFPYPKALPPPQEDPSEYMGFFGLSENSNLGADFAIPRSDPTMIVQDDSKILKLQQLLQVSDSKVFDLQQALLSKDQRIQELQLLMQNKTQEIATAQKIIQETREKNQEALKLIPSQDEIKQLKGEKDVAIKQLNSITIKLQESKEECEDLKAKNEELKKELDSMPNKSEVEELKSSIEKLKSDDRALRFRAGQILLKGLDFKDEGTEFAQGKAHLQDNEVLQRLEASLKGNHPSFKQRLIDADSNKDGKITKVELTKVLAQLALVPQDIVSILRIAGFRPGVTLIAVSDIADILNGREQRMTELETQLFSKLKQHFDKSSLDIDQAFQFLDVNGDGNINFQELSDALDTINMPLSREDRHSLFAVLDSDHGGSISLAEFKEKIDKAVILPPKAKEVPKKEEPTQNRFKSEFNEKIKANPMALGSLVKFPEQPKQENAEENQKVPEKPQVERKQSRKLNGSLVVGVVKGKGLGQGTFAIQVTLKGTEKTLKTPFLQGPDPDWKLKSTLKLFDTSTAQIDSELYLELLGDRGMIASCRINWLSVLDFPNSWAIKSDFPLLEPNNRKHGSVMIHLMWMPKDALRMEGSGSLSLQILSCSGFGSARVQLAVGTQNVMGNLKESEELIIKDIALKADELIPSLKFTALSSETLQMILWKNLSMEVAISSSPNWTPSLKVPLDGDCELAIRMKWTPISEEDEAKEKAATKIQAIFRGNKAREEVKPMMKSKRKILARKVWKENGRYYMVTIYEQDTNYKVELNPADDPSLPMYTELHSLNVPKQPIEDIFKNLSVLANQKLSYSKEAAQPSKNEEPKFPTKKAEETKILQKPTAKEQEEIKFPSKKETKDEEVKFPAKKQAEEEKFPSKKTTATSQAVKGGVMIEILSSVNVKSSYCRVEYGEAFVHSTAGPPWTKKIALSDVEINSQILPLTIKIYALETRTEIASGSVDWSHAATVPESWTPPTTVNIGNAKLEVKFMWSPYKSKQKEPQQATPSMTTEDIKPKEHRKVLMKKGIKRNNKYYLVCVYEARSGKEMELHLVDQPNIPMYEAVDKAIIEKSADLESVIANMEISANNKMIFKT